MSNPDDSAASDKAEQLHAVVNSIREFDKLKLPGTISTQTPTAADLTNRSQAMAKFSMLTSQKRKG